MVDRCAHRRRARCFGKRAAFRDLPAAGDCLCTLNAPGEPAVKVLTAVEAVDSSTKLAAAAAGLFDANGKLTAQWTANAEIVTTR